MEQLFINFPDVVSVKEMSEMLKIGIVLAYKLVKSGEIKSRKIGRDFKIQKNNIIEYLNVGK